MALGEQLDQLKLTQALQTGGAELVQPANPPSSPSSPKPLRNVLLGIVLGALLGFGLAALLERIDRRVRTVDEFEELYAAPILARIPRSPRLTKKQTEAIGPQTPEGEAFRVLRANLRYFNVDGELRSILITSPEAGDGKSTVARVLATTMAEMGDDVVLVEGDLRKGGDLLDVTGSPSSGLSNVLTGTPFEKVLIDDRRPRRRRPAVAHPHGPAQRPGAAQPVRAARERPDARPADQAPGKVPDRRPRQPGAGGRERRAGAGLGGLGGRRRRRPRQDAPATPAGNSASSSRCWTRSRSA